MEKGLKRGSENGGRNRGRQGKGISSNHREGIRGRAGAADYYSWRSWVSVGDRLWFDREEHEAVVVLLSGQEIIRTCCGWQCRIDCSTEQVVFICK